MCINVCKRERCVCVCVYVCVWGTQQSSGLAYQNRGEPHRHLWIFIVCPMACKSQARPRHTQPVWKHGILITAMSILLWSRRASVLCVLCSVFRVSTSLTHLVLLHICQHTEHFSFCKEERKDFIVIGVCVCDCVYILDKCFQNNFISKSCTQLSFHNKHKKILSSIFLILCWVFANIGWQYQSD